MMRGHLHWEGMLIADTSARVRSTNPAVATRWSAIEGADRIATCSIVTLELLHHERDAAGIAAAEQRESRFRKIPIDTSVQNAALGAVRELSQRGGGYHRVPLPDVLIAAAAQEAGADVLHYDRHFDRLSEVLHFRSVWLAPAGSLS